MGFINNNPKQAALIDGRLKHLPPFFVQDKRLWVGWFPVSAPSWSASSPVDKQLHEIPRCHNSFIGIR